MTLIEFLLARIADDEELARAAEGEDYFIEDGWHTANFLDHHNPARVLAECEAKRRIVGQAVAWNESEGDRQGAQAIGSAVRYLALPYADHPDYRSEWAV